MEEGAIVHEFHEEASVLDHESPLLNAFCGGEGGDAADHFCSL